MKLQSGHVLHGRKVGGGEFLAILKTFVNDKFGEWII